MTPRTVARIIFAEHRSQEVSVTQLLQDLRAELVRGYYAPRPSRNGTARLGTSPYGETAGGGNDAQYRFAKPDPGASRLTCDRCRHPNTQ